MSSVYEEKKNRIQDKIDCVQKELDDYWSNTSSEMIGLSNQRYIFILISQSV